MRMGHLVCRFNPWIISFEIIWEVESIPLRRLKWNPLISILSSTCKDNILLIIDACFLDCFQLFVLTLFLQIIWNFLQQLFFIQILKSLNPNPIHIYLIGVGVWATILGSYPNGHHSNHKSWFGMGHNFGLLPIMTTMWTTRVGLAWATILVLLPNGHQHDAQELGERYLVWLAIHNKFM
jgi:hypothetical protein